MSLFLKIRRSAVILGLLGTSTFTASADVFHVLPGLGGVQNAAVFTLGFGFFGDSVSGDAYVGGDVMVAGNGRITLSGNATIDGDVYYRSNGSVRALDHAEVTGGIHNDDDAGLDSAVAGARGASDAAFAMAPNRPNSNINLKKRGSLTISGAPGETVVLRLRDFRLAGNSVLTLQGTATTTFIINVSRQFSLSGNARIVLAGGLQWNDVLFNVRGLGTVSIKGNASLQGILLANGRTVVMSGHSTVTGEIIANKVLLSGGSRVIHPPITSP